MTVRTASTTALEARPATLVLVNDDSYASWAFSSTSATQGRRFTNARDLITGNHADLFETGAAIEAAPRAATRAELALVHDPAYIAGVLDAHQCGEWSGQRPDLADLAQRFAGGTLVALEHLLEGRTRLAVHLAGAKHHAQRDRSSGFCVFADLAIAARIAGSQGLRVAIFDFDAHHGDGTENLCADLPGVMTYSIHQSGIFPFTGMSSDPSRGIYNVPVDALRERDAHADDETLLEATRDFTAKAREFGADLVFLAAGADGHVNDPLSTLQYSEAGVTCAMREMSAGLDAPVLMCGAGGYRPDDDTPAMWAAAVAGLVTDGV